MRQLLLLAAVAAGAAAASTRGSAPSKPAASKRLVSSAPLIYSRPAAGAAAASASADVADSPNPVPLSSAFVSASGVFPALTVVADTAPDVPPGDAKRSECGTGAMMAWADMLYVVSYLSVPNAGNGTGLYQIDANLQMTKIASHTSVYANRLIIPAMDVIVIGPYIIDAYGNVRVISSLLNVRIGGMAQHIVNPDHMVYMLGMDGPLWEVDLLTGATTQLYNLTETLNIDLAGGEQPHFKAAWTLNGTLTVASNTFEEMDGVGVAHGGRLASWSGNAADDWVILERTAFVEVTSRQNFGRTQFALGWDDASVILRTTDYGDVAAPSWNTTTQVYRLPKASHAYDHLWTTEWPRIREVESERYLMDMHGLFYELAPYTWGGGAWGVRPISQHLRMVPDFASFRGFLVLGGNQVSSIFDNNLVTGQSQSGLWFGKTDDLWSFGKPQGWGGPWLYDAVSAGQASDPYLMTGFDKKSLHLRIDPPLPGSGAPWPAVVNVKVQLDFTGSAGFIGAKAYLQPWNTLQTVTLNGTGSDGAYAHVDLSGVSAHWVRFVADTAANITAYLTYT